MQILARRYDTGGPVRLEIAGGKLTQVVPWAAEAGQLQGWPWIAPGLVDLQVNGYGGQEFSSPALTVERVLGIVRAISALGVSRFCPTVTTERFEVLRHALSTICAARRASPEAAYRMVGIHLEGPYLTRDDGARGAHPAAYCRPPDWDEFQRLQEAADGWIRVLTMSVEFDRSPAFIERVAGSGVVVAIGHTAANPDQIRAAADAGARLSTHLGNGTHTVLPRHPNYLWAQLAEDRLMASLIVDGHHLPPEVVQTFVRAKTPQRCILISDLSGLAGLPPGRYQGNTCEVEILADGRLVVAGQRQILAGASAPISSGIGNVIGFAGVGLADAIDMAVAHPAGLVGIDPGNLRPGDPADLVLFDLVEPRDRPGVPSFEVRALLVRGEVLFGSPGQAS